MKRLELSVWSVGFWLSIVCQATVLPATLGLGVLSRIANTAVLALFAAGALLTLARRHAEKVAVFYLLPAFLVLIGYVINIGRSGSLEALSHLGLVVPWLAILSVPFVRGLDWERYWRHFHRFMFWGSVVALLEYAGMLMGYIVPVAIDTDLGQYNKGVLTIFYSLGNGEAGNFPRLYGVFPEPGTFAMFLLPAISYALVMRKPLALAVYIPCMVFTASLGGYIGLALVGAPFVIWLMRGRHVLVGLGIVGVSAVILAVIGPAIYDYVQLAYAMRGDSASVRESNVQSFLQNVLPALAAHPFGFALEGHAFSELQGEDFYFGSNFSLATAAVTGGVLAFIGYLTFVLANLVTWSSRFLHRRSTGVEAVALLCLPALVSFIVQRATIFESVLYAYLFAPLVVATLRNSSFSAELDFLGKLRIVSAENK